MVELISIMTELKKRFSQLISPFVLGFFFTAIQSIFYREFLSMFSGNELITGIFFGFWFLGNALGALYAGRMSDKLKKHRKIFLELFTIFFFLVTALFFSLRIFRLVINIPYFNLIPLHFTLILSLITVLPVSLINGFLFVILTCVLKTKYRKEAINITYLVDSTGSFSMGILFAFVLTGVLPHLMIILFLAIFSLYALMIANKKIIFLRLVILPFIIMLIFSPELDLLLNKLRLKGLNPRLNYKESLDSKYQNITVGEEQGKYYIYINGIFASSFPEKKSAEMDCHILMNLVENPRSVLIAGGGYYDFFTELAKYKFDSLSYLEMDREMLKILNKYSEGDIKQIDKRIKFINMEVVETLKGDEKFDLIILNLPDPLNSQLNRYYTEEFYGLVSESLNPGGVVTFEITGSINYASEESVKLLASVYWTCRDNFEYIIVLPGDKMRFIASDKPLIMDGAFYAHRFRKKDIKVESFSAEYFYKFFPVFKIEEFQNRMQEYKDTARNTNMNPISYYQSIKIWNVFSNTKINPVLDFIERWFFLIFIIIIFVFLFVLFSKNGKTGYMSVIFSTGIVSITMQIILILIFQSYLGFVYSRIALFTGIFMLGLSLGAFLIYRVKEKFKKVLMISEAIYLFLIIIMLLVFKFISLERMNTTLFEFFFYILVLLNGIIAGSQFPLVSKVLLVKNNNTGRIASSLDIADHSGAFVGSILVATLLIPVIGMLNVILLLLVLKFLNFLNLILKKG